MAYRNYSTAIGFIVDPNGFGDFKTIASAIAAASSGTTIYIRPGTYTENLTFKTGVNLTSALVNAQAAPATGIGQHVVISGKGTLSAGDVEMSGICFQTNGDYALSATGTAEMNLIGCWINATNHAALQTQDTSTLNLYYCNCDVINPGIGLFATSSANPNNGLTFFGCTLFNAGNTATASTIATGTVAFRYSYSGIPFSLSGTSQMGAEQSTIDCNTENATAIALTGTTTAAFVNCYLTSGTAVTMTVGAGCTATVANCVVNTTNINAFTGGGTLNYGNIVFTGSGTGNTVTTSTALTKLG